MVNLIVSTVRSKSDPSHHPKRFQGMSMSINYRDLRARLRIEDVLGWMSWKASSRLGHQLRGRCPLCSESTGASGHASSSGRDRTFSVNTQRNIYRCFKCNQSGNAIDLWSSYRRLPIYSAAQELEARLSQNKQPPKCPQPTVIQATANQPPPLNWLNS
jgi:DNA primase